VIAERLKAQPGKTIAEQFDEVTALFADVVGFTGLSERLSPHESVALLNEVFTAFDRFANRHGVEKIRTIGDGYMVVAGAPVRRDDHCDAIARMALDMRDWMAERRYGDQLPIQIRIGINSGTAVGAVVGTSRFHYDLWGDAINVAARMESLGEPGRIHVAEGAWRRLRRAYQLEPQGELEVKGKGSMPTWYLEAPL
jgi:class 3 adenylate cyclase